MTRREKIVEIHKYINPFVNKGSNLGLLPLIGVLKDGTCFNNVDLINYAYTRKFVAFDDSKRNRFKVIKENVSPSLWLAVLIMHNLSSQSLQETKKILNNIILSNPKKYYIK